MNAQGPATAVGQNLEISTGLGCFHDAESVFLVGHWQIGGIIAGDLQEDAGVRAAFVGLSGGMQEARAKAEASGGVLFIAHGMTKLLKFGFVRGVIWMKAEQREVVASADAIEMGAQIAGKILSLPAAFARAVGILSDR